MSNTYTLIKQIHTEIKRVEEKTGINTEIDFDKSIDEESGMIYPRLGFLGYFEPPQIRQILVGLQEVLGENPEYKAIKTPKIKDPNNPWELMSAYPGYGEHAEDGFLLGKANSKPQSQAEALCNRWLDGLEPLFDREPETVLKELVEILQNLLK